MLSSFKKLLPHLIVLVSFIVCALLYFNPVLKGKEIYQSDIVHYIGMAQQQKEFKAETGQETYWTNSAFGGMPTFQLGAKYPHNYIKKLDSVLRFLPRPADYLFLYFLGFYILLLTLKIDYKLSAIGALAFGFSTYLIIILGVGHNSKAHAIAYFPLVLSGILLVFQKRYLLGFFVTVISLALEIVANHYQMTYYLLLLVLVFGLVQLYHAYKTKVFPHFFKAIGVLFTALILAISLNATNLLATSEYVKESVRGPSELTINSDGSKKESTSGLSKEYITEYSYGLLETFNLFIPHFLGGGSYEDVGVDSETYNVFRSMGASPVQARQEVERTPTYWGDQTILEAPAYIGAIVIFLFCLGLFLVKGKTKWWLLGGSILSLILSYGDTAPFGFITDFFIDYVPLYNKFRAVSSIQVILELCIPVLGIFGLSKLINSDTLTNEEKQNALKYTTLITVGFCTLILLFGGLVFDFVGNNDGMYLRAYGNEFIEALRNDRKHLLISDTWRALILVLVVASSIYFYLKNKLKENYLLLIVGVLIVFDLVSIDRIYVNNDNFVAARRMKIPFTKDKIDVQILKDKSHFKVLDVSSGSSPSRASYFHNSLTGYHAARLRRMNELFDFYLLKDNINVVNMLNTKYIIGTDKSTGKRDLIVNKNANGNAWFVSKLEKLNSANDEILSLGELDNKNVAVTTEDKLKTQTFKLDSLASISLKSFQPNKMDYISKNSNDGFVVFSELFYSKGWKATIDGKEVPIYKVNYALRGLEVPSGSHNITFVFDPQVVKTGSTITLISSIIVGLLMLIGLFIFYKNKNA